MADCSHALQNGLRVSACQRGSLLNPRNWACSDCGTTESVWACLTCSHFACGRGANGHSMKHYESTRHPLAIEVNHKYVHCYVCDDWVLNDSLSEDIKLIQSLLYQVTDQNYNESTTRSGKIIRPSSVVFKRRESRYEEVQSRNADMQYTATFHYKSLILSKMFAAWRKFMQLSKLEVTVSESRKRKRMIAPGMTGLRNLGNTCYMNSALQALGHLQFLRETFRQMGTQQQSQDSTSSVLFNRQTTIECFQHISSKPEVPNSRLRLKRQTGLTEQTQTDHNDSMVSLTQEIHGLMRVMWSGKWAVVTPHTVLSAVWTHIPSFRGYCQQDAQEFLCQLLDQLQNELLKFPSELIIKISSPWTDTVLARDLLKSLFEGQIISRITYTNCKHSSFVCESFWDLSLEIPATMVQNTSSRRSLSNSSTLFDSLNKFTSTEHIGDNIFECSCCPGQRQSIDKQLLIKDPPEVLRIHLKRFRYINNCWRKLTNQIEFPIELNMYHYCNHDNQSVGVVNGEEDTLYDLSSVIVHHGSYSNTGHYTAYCWNNDAGCWVHCNDAKLSRSSSEEVLKSQAYVLFYARRRGRSPVLNRINNNDELPPDTKHIRQ